MLLLALVATLVAGVLTLGYIHAKVGPLSHLPGPTWVLPFSGQMPALAADPTAMMWSCYRKYGTVFRAHLFGQQMAVVGDPSLIKQSLSSNDEVTSCVPVTTVSRIVDLYQIANPHRSMIFRKTMALALTVTNVKARLPLFMDVLTKHVDTWTDRPAELNLEDRLQAMVVAFGLGPIAGFQVKESLLNRIRELALVIQAGLFTAPIYFPGTTWYKAINARSEYLDLLKQVVHVRFHVNELGVVTGPKEGQMPGTIDTSEVLFKEFQDAQDTPTVDKFAERLVQNVLGATETTSSMMLGLFYAVQVVPGLQDKLREEQRRVIEQHGPDMTFEAASQHMPLLDATVKETLRLSPPGHMVFRRVNVDDLHVGGHHLPRGTAIVVSVDIQSFLDPKVQRKADPARGNRPPVEHDMDRFCEGFSAQRWLNTDHGDSPQLHTFSYGPHSCLGMNLAILEAKLVMATVLRKGTLELLNKNPRLVAFPRVRLANGAMRVRFTPDPLV